MSSCIEKIFLHLFRGTLIAVVTSRAASIKELSILAFGGRPF